MHPLVAIHKDEIVELCRHHRIQQLEIFGSAARGDDFDPEHSDVDFLVEFAPDSDYPALAEYFDFNEALAKLLGRPVDLVMGGGRCGIRMFWRGSISRGDRSMLSDCVLNRRSHTPHIRGLSPVIRTVVRSV